MNLQVEIIGRFIFKNSKTQDYNVQKIQFYFNL